ncbi:MAG: hypothetical protein JXR49_02525 [Acidobacteria bacterium]|nr:hypothetical protein [Acidobacteriota bacterium]
MAMVPATGGGGCQSATAYGQSTNYSVPGSRPVGMAYMLDNTDIRNQMDHGTGVSVMGTSCFPVSDSRFFLACRYCGLP